MPGGNSTTSHLGRALRISRPCRLYRTKGLLETFSQEGIGGSSSLIDSKSLPGVSQAHIKAKPCPELWCFVWSQIFIEQLLHARHRRKIKARMRLLRRKWVWRALLPNRNHSQATSSRRPTVATPTHYLGTFYELNIYLTLDLCYLLKYKPLTLPCLKGNLIEVCIICAVLDINGDYCFPKKALASYQSTPWPTGKRNPTLHHLLLLPTINFP